MCQHLLNRRNAPRQVVRKHDHYQPLSELIEKSREMLPWRVARLLPDAQPLAL